MLKCAIFANFLDFVNGCCYLNTIARKKGKKHMGFLHFCLRSYITYWFKYIDCFTLGWSWEKKYVKMCLFGRFLRF